MRRSTILAVITALMMLGSALPAGAAPPEIIVDPGELVQVIDGIFITVEPNGTVSVIDGIFVEKYSNGGRPLSISVSNATIEFTIIPGGCLDPKGC